MKKSTFKKISLWARLIKHLRRYELTYIVALVFTLISLITFSYIHIKRHTWDISTKLERIKIDSLHINGNDEESLRNGQLFYNFKSSEIAITSTLIAIIGVILTFMAFYIQYTFNMRQKRDISNERFENHYFHFLDIYRNICNNIEINGVGRGKVAFHYMFYEFKAVYNLLQNDERLKDLTTQNKLDASITLFLNGVSYDFKPKIEQTIMSEEILVDTRDNLLDLQTKSEQHTSSNKTDKGVKYLRDYMGKNIKYFDGHRQRLIHYFKYIFLIIDHIDTTLDISTDEKLEKLKYLISEMTDHEIGVFYAYVHSSLCGPESELKYRVGPNYEPYLDFIFNELNNDTYRYDKPNFITKQ